MDKWAVKRTNVIKEALARLDDKTLSNKSKLAILRILVDLCKVEGK